MENQVQTQQQQPKQLISDRPRKEAIPISGPELARILLANLAKSLATHSRLHEVCAYPGAKVEFLLRVTPQPVEENNPFLVSFSEILDLSNPPDVVRILNGLPVWDSAKVVLDGYVQRIEVPATAGEELKKAAEVVVKGTQVAAPRPVVSKK